MIGQKHNFLLTTAPALKGLIICVGKGGGGPGSSLVMALTFTRVARDLSWIITNMWDLYE